MTSQHLLSLLLDGVHDVEMMMRTLDMTSLYRLNHMLRGINCIEKLSIRSDHLNHIHSQILRLLLHVSRTRPRAWLTFMCISLFILTCIIDI